MKNPLLDEVFLHELDLFPHKFIWVKIIALNWEEYPLEEITGRITSGTINVDGSSAIRRTCNLTLVANNVNVNNFYWSLNTKFKVEIGLENWINSEYPEIIWFKQGTFIISSFNCSVGPNNYTINIQGKDKMVLLNGEVGGIIPSSWDFGTEDETLEDGKIQNNQIPIKDIVLQAVHEYTQEGWQNIIVNDLDDYGIELLEYQGGTPLYYIIDYDGGQNDSREVMNMTLKGDMECWVRQDSWDDVNNCRIVGNWAQSSTTISQIESDSETDNTSNAGRLCYEKLIEQIDPSGAVTETKNYLRAIISLKNPNDDDFDDSYLRTVAKITRDNGLQVCGYRICDIVYPYDLIASPGDALTSILDKLVQMLGNFEYFYDVDGRFIFQKKKTYLDVSYNNILNEHSISEEVWADNSEYSSKYSYTFDKDVLVSSFQNSPNLPNLKNDYSLWGQKKIGNVSIPIHMRYAIDHKPSYYKTWDGEIYISKEGVSEYGEIGNVVDWREIIYRMANDYRRHYRNDEDFLIKIRDNSFINDKYLYPEGYTGYEKYYVDFEMNLSQGVVAYWRELYNPECISQGLVDQKVHYRSSNPNDTVLESELSNWSPDEVYAKNDLIMYQGEAFRSTQDNNKTEPTSKNAKWARDFFLIYNSDGWNPDILNNPEMLNFWFDFLDTDGELNKYSVCNIGQRSKAANDDKIKAIYFRETPNVIFELADNLEQTNWRKPGYAHIRIPQGLDNLFNISSRGKNAMDVVQEYLYNYTYPVSAITMKTIPIFYLTPNTLIYVDDKATGVAGEYIMQKFSFQLGANAQMTINAVETAKRIY